MRTRSLRFTRALGQRAKATSTDFGARMVFLGAPGVGKGTFASRLAPAWGIPTISTGDLVRAEIRRGSELGRKIQVRRKMWAPPEAPPDRAWCARAQGFNDRGLLVPDSVMIGMVRGRAPLQPPRPPAAAQRGRAPHRRTLRPDRSS